VMRVSNPLADVLRLKLLAAHDSGRSLRSLAAEAGVSQPTLSMFIRGGDIRTDTVHRLCCVLGIRTVRVS
jgi:DNA-binding Xre family transcriptional regulator